MSGMKRLWVLAASLLLLVGCSANRQELRVVGGGLESVSLAGSPIEALVRVDLDNPRGRFEVYDISGVVKKGKKEALNFTADPFVVPARSQSTEKIALQATLAPGFGLLELIRTISAQDLNNIYIDLDCTIKGAFGAKRQIQLKNIPLKDITDKI